LLIILKAVSLFPRSLSKTAQTRFWVFAKNTFKAKATIKIPAVMDCGGTGNGSVKPINNKYTLPSIL
jgi:hypothetical protein